MARYLLLLILFFIICTFVVSALLGAVRRFFGITPPIPPKPHKSSFASIFTNVFKSGSTPEAPSPATSNVIYKNNDVVVLQGDAKSEE